jgi:putative restriction endonuclease
MGLGDITADGVRQAMAEFDELGRDAFLAKHGFGKAREYFLIAEDRRYDSKAIAGVAHGYSGSGRQPLIPTDFSGGEATVAAVLDSLGFQVIRLSKDEDKSKGRLGKVSMLRRIGAKLTNDRWGWDAIMPDGSIVFIGWDYRVTRSPTGDLEACEIYHHGAPHNDKTGGRERARHIEHLLATGAAGYLVVAKPKNQKVSPHEIESVDENLYSVRLEERDGYVYAHVVGSNSAPEIEEPDAAADIQAVLGDENTPETEKPQLVQARRGQGLFRSRVELIETGCRLTGVTDRAHLRASHIKPWRDSTNAERLDGNNGLLLAPHIDHLFDRGFVSFDADGRLMLSPRLNADVLTAWSISVKLVSVFSSEQQVYLAYHRATVFLEQ